MPGRVVYRRAFASDRRVVDKEKTFSYKVEIMDACATSALLFYFTRSPVIRETKPAAREELKEENSRLREENHQLKERLTRMREEDGNFKREW